MRLIDADKFKGKAICNHTYGGVLKIININDIPTAYDIDKVVEELEKELSLADKEKERCTGENNLQFDSAKGYASGISTAIEIIKQGGVGKDVE